MIKITTRMGYWNDEAFKRELHWEMCPNPDCPTELLHYTNMMENPHCPDCKTLLPGAMAELRDGPEARIAWHKEAV